MKFEHTVNPAIQVSESQTSRWHLDTHAQLMYSFARGVPRFSLVVEVSAINAGSTNVSFGSGTWALNPRLLVGTRVG